MFEEIFFPRTAERYRAAPLVEQRERYLVHLKETGARRPTLRKCANDQLSLVRLLELKDGDKVGVSQIEAATAIWSQPKGRRCDRSASAKARTRFVNHAVRWLSFLGWLDESERARHPHGAQVEAYEAWMRGDRGLSEETIRDYRAAADQFFEWLPATDIPLASVRITDIDGAIMRQEGAGNLRPKSDARLRPASSRVLSFCRSARLVHAGHCRGDHASAFQAGRGRAEGVEAGGCPAPLGHHGGRPTGRQARPRNSDVVHRLRPEGRRSRWVAPG